jgi:hypothetical protein
MHIVEVYKEKLGEGWNSSHCWKIEVNGLAIPEYWDANSAFLAEQFARGVGKGLSWSRGEKTKVILANEKVVYFANH